MAHIAERVAEAIEAERLVEGTGHAEDEAYNRAIDDALAAVEAVADEPDPLRELAEWLVSLDDPEDVVGREQRRTVTLNQVIERAREALGKEG